jgi:hypothetical protein
MSNAFTQTKTKRAAQPQNQAAKNDPEWGDEKTIFRLFGITRTPLFNLRKAGKIRSISTAHGGATYGKRLFNVQSVRDFLEAQEIAENTNKNGGAAL